MGGELSCAQLVAKQGIALARIEVNMRNKPKAHNAWEPWLQQMRQPASPGRIDHPFRVVGREDATTEAKVGRAKRKVAVRQYELKVPYLDMSGRPRTGKARLFVPPGAKEPMPLVVAMHYELGLASAAEYLAQGWAAVTPREGLSPFGESMNVSLAVLQASRLMPFVDQQRIAITGGSAGGYMTLMVASEAFPITAAAAIAPLVNIAYNVEYFARNAVPAACGAKDEKGNDASRVPVLCSVLEAVKGFGRFLGPVDETWQSWLQNSPVGVTDLITCPAFVPFSTADVLVPINQVADRFVVRAPAGTFPKGFAFDRSALVKPPGGRKTFMQAVGRRARVFRVKMPRRLTPFWEATKPGAKPVDYQIPCLFSRSDTVSVVILDEGAPDPRIGHFKYHFRCSAIPFFKHWFSKKAPLAPEQLTLRKLEILMRRFRGEDFEGLVGYEEPGKPPAPVSRRNRPAREKIDVIGGLGAYSKSGKAHRERLAMLYHRLPPTLRALDVRSARFDDDVIGGLAYHEAVLHYRYGETARARALARILLRKPEHRAYAACLSAGLRVATTR